MRQNEYAMVIDQDGYKRYWAGDCWSRHFALRQRLTLNDLEHKNWKDNCVLFIENDFQVHSEKTLHPSI